MCALYEAHTTTPFLIMCVNRFIFLYVMYYSQSLRGCFLGGADDLKSQASDTIIRAPPHEPAPHWLAHHNNNFNLTAIAYLAASYQCNR